MLLFRQSDLKFQTFLKSLYVCKNMHEKNYNTKLI